ncbi:hypothetical protein FOXG_16767 [Fusarium oxysporum f. sp. lycopersici 4287]|uniref:Uncharacterized protein n=3 Tax=Fusarium oxysporum TaxID=5507 RepID=A0A0J9WA88_FUSO4|nr:hypothetical protein FOXG_16702 [Fusarium oxysporum f. sp. lycopersici 4287]XP_018257547.1 hypothetical protein FOXG_16767 [Fusarium oxysporum f. sp. lycopersici 4287]EXK23961.1 hypothetical protein FOMG_19292 [Fusarium oxysporum f. sp. melonis 26406]KAJ9413188.1 hypothetical protein QL093DRAFT_2510432 [Fusarium oxysporum]KNB19416.1 hypothetical protein FOXG_16702 [Fusarium oxysporum f. sp. lycopersici 4287]KNB19502.1 hypothetical protein FOXG_16767 [Fusarium oxysporum f. sp. lycopersici 42
MSYLKDFETTWGDPKNTAITTPDSDVNATVEKYYMVDEPFTYTKTQVWDMEVKKAHRPDKYIYQYVRQGSLHTFDHRKEGPYEYFTRITAQRTWKNPEEYDTVIERVCLDHVNQAAFFLGTPEVTLPDGTKVKSGEKQSIFNVEHAVAGTEENPLNTWRIVYLTNGRDESLIELLKPFQQDVFLQPYNEVYIREELGRDLVRKDI